MGKAKRNGDRKRRAAEAELFGVIGHAARASRSVLARRLLDSGLYAGQDALMLALDAQDGRTPSQIAAELGVRAPTVTKTVNRLAERGFVRKTASESDGRLAHVHLTDAGHAAIAAIRSAVADSEALAADGLSGKELRTLVKLLKRIDRNLQGAQAAQGAQGHDGSPSAGG